MLTMKEQLDKTIEEVGFPEKRLKFEKEYELKKRILLEAVVEQLLDNKMPETNSSVIERLVDANLAMLIEQDFPLDTRSDLYRAVNALAHVVHNQSTLQYQYSNEQLSIVLEEKLR